MIGRYDEDTNDVRYRDLAEFGTMEILKQTFNGMKAEGKEVSTEALRDIRRRWMRGDQPIDFTSMRASQGDMLNLLRLTGAKDYGVLGTIDTPEDELRVALVAHWSTAIKTFDASTAKGVHLHTVTDLELYDNIIAPSGQPLTKAVFAHHGKSARELNLGDTAVFTSRNDTTPVYNSVVAGTVAQASAQTTGAPTPSSSAARTQTRPPAVPVAPPAMDFEEFENSNDMLIGWDGATIDDVKHRGLSHIFGAYLTKADIDIVKKNIDPNGEFDPALAYSSLELVQHLRSNGHGFKVKENSIENRIEVATGVGDNLTVRIFDTDDRGKYIGRVYDRYNAYYTDVSASKAERDKIEYTTEDAIRVIDYVMGNEPGKIKKSNSSDSSEVRIKGMTDKKYIRVLPSTKNADIYRALKFKDAAEAEMYIGDGIEKAQAFVDAEFKAEAFQAMLDAALDDDDVLLSGNEFQAELDAFYSLDPAIREAQEQVAAFAKHSDDNGMRDMLAAKNAIVGNYKDGFNPAFVVDHMGETDRGNDRDAMMSAIKVADYDIDKLKGNDFAVNAMKERLIKFDPETAKGIDDIDHPMKKQALLTVQETLRAGQFVGEGGWGTLPDVKMDENGIVRWEAKRKTGSNKEPFQDLTGEIGQIMVPDEHGIIKTQFQGDNNYGIVPGYTGYFAFDGDYDDRMSRFRAKGFEQHLTEQLQAKVTHQMTRPYDKVLEDIPTTLDASSLNGLYHGDVYGKRIELDWYEANQLDNNVKDAILTTLSNRVRFDNQYSDYATTSAETQANRELGAGDDSAAFSYWKAAGETNMRVLNADLENYADLNMTGTGKTQGLVWYMADGAKVNEDGSVTPSEGRLNDKGELVPDQTAVMKLDYFNQAQFDAWDRPQMSANQILTAVKVDPKVKTALVTFGGWNLDDGFPISKEMADRNLVKGAVSNDISMQILQESIYEMHDNKDMDYAELVSTTMDPYGMRWSSDVIKEGVELYTEMQKHKGRTAESYATYEAFESYLDEHGVFRPAQRGDKISDMHGNKGLIGIVVDRDTTPEEAKYYNLEQEVAYMKANPELDMIGSPYSPLSRHNSGLLKEMQSGELSDLIDPKTGEVALHPVTGEPAKDVIGELDVIITDIHVDNKTKAYSREDELAGKGRKGSGQLAWALQSKDATGLLNEIYGRNDSAWSTYREYLIATGLDMKADGTITEGYTPHHDETRHHFQHDADTSSNDFLNEIQDQGGFLDVPFDMQFKTGEITNEVPVLSASLRQNVELVDGTMRRSDFTNSYERIYEAVGNYENAESDEDKVKAQTEAQSAFDKIQSTIIDRQFDGGHNGKHSYIRDKMMGKRMQNSATAVAIPDPRLDIGEAGMNQEMMDALNAQEGDTVMMFRDPVWRDGAIRAMTVKYDESVHGVSFNPITDKSHDGDFDGDTYGIIKFESKEAINDLKTKFSHSANMLDMGPGEVEHKVEIDGVETEVYKRPLYFQSGMDFVSADAGAKAKGDLSGQRLYEKADEQARSNDPRVQKMAEKNLSKYAQKSLRDNGFASEWVSLTDEASVERSMQRISESGAKGNAKAPGEVMKYYRGEKTWEDAREVQYATGVKSDATGLAGAYSQKLIAAMRNVNPKSATESMYPLTQGTLQIKKSADHARTVNGVLTEDMPRIFRGKDLENPKKDSVSPKTFKKQLTRTMHDTVGVDVAEEHIDAVTEAMTVNNKIVPLTEVMALKGSPMDRVAYGGGYDELKRLAKKEESLLEGKYSKLFAPYSMRNATDETKIVKRDTQRVAPKEVTPDFGVDVKASAVSVASVTPEAEHASDSGMVL